MANDSLERKPETGSPPEKCSFSPKPNWVSPRFKDQKLNILLERKPLNLSMLISTLQHWVAHKDKWTSRITEYIWDGWILSPLEAAKSTHNTHYPTHLDTHKHIHLLNSGVHRTHLSIHPSIWVPSGGAADRLHLHAGNSGEGSQAGALCLRPNWRQFIYFSFIM